jgi:hypothetical protein
LLEPPRKRTCSAAQRMSRVYRSARRLCSAFLHSPTSAFRTLEPAVTAGGGRGTRTCPETREGARDNEGQRADAERGIWARIDAAHSHLSSPAHADLEQERQRGEEARKPSSCVISDAARREGVASRVGDDVSRSRLPLSSPAHADLGYERERGGGEDNEDDVRMRTVLRDHGRSSARTRGGERIVHSSSCAFISIATLRLQRTRLSGKLGNAQRRRGGKGQEAETAAKTEGAAASVGGVSVACTCTAHTDLGYKRERGGGEDARRTSASARKSRRERVAEQRACTRRGIRAGIWRPLPGIHIPGMSQMKTIRSREQRAYGV